MPNNNVKSVAMEYLDKPISECTNQELYYILLKIVQREAKLLPVNNEKKKLYYISAEFLIGKMLSNNLLNLGIYDEVKAELAANGKSLDDIELAEIEPSLGNGGLGRLAACFLDSQATLGLTADGVGLNYHFGLFQQFFKFNQQGYKPDEWLIEPTWLTKSDVQYEVPFARFTLTSTLYDLEVLGYKQETRNRLRLFDLDSVNADIIEKGSISFDKTNIEENLTLFLYPDDSDRNGELLRIYQQYFMVSNAAQLIIDEALEKGSNLHDLDEYAVVQINDTHPALIIPEFVRLLTTKHGLTFEEAVDVVSKVVAFTNHTILQEALEKWPMNYLDEIIPDVANIIRGLSDLVKHNFPGNDAVSIIDNNDRAHMAHMAIHYGFSVNGVARLHTEILKNSELKAFYDIYPERFNNKTNGITFRRWIMASNHELSEFLDEKIGRAWHHDADLTGLYDFQDDEEVYQKLAEIKATKKEHLAEHLRITQNIPIRTNSIIDVQIKRIHEYKRQQMLALYIIKKYQMIKAGQKPKTPITILFGGKAAPAYTIAQDIIHLILTLSDLIQRDPEVRPYLQVEMVENYNVTEAEYLIPAADISEQISLASKEASGTGNMKFMLNGALILCTLDGANVEIAEKVGEDNIYIFGRSSEEIVDLYARNAYSAHDYYHREAIKPIVDFIVSDEMLELGNKENLRRLHTDIANKDYFMALIDLEEFIDVKEQMYADYEDQEAWMRKVLVNIAEAGYFSSDRTIREYNDDIWHLESNYQTEA
ncbi:maltose phosphorylase [Aerococcus urinaehominis]|uniref:Alpha-1,4 glucan phosphorylase n=1 Tax=Aerococcus urinaehominis TaxID=128944 RepID=A0A0X8FL07_9LACT|nr:glycogen/starch/alpha-glucan phosphorylase [Aerococcus urinaehominis]AMB99271.1 maltose phosphorylase [Aerococcus urinaehominis]SDM47313.1 starch phosphorylase [Aerococcus urinaehominis]